MEKTYKRKFILDHLKANLAFPAHVLQILQGPRQVGKTTAIKQFLSTWPDPSYYATADQLTPPDTEWLAEQWRAARKLAGTKPLLVIDEIQKVPHWSEAVKKLHDEDAWEKRPLRVVLLGSSALLMQRGMTESLAGRFQLIRCPHWSYRECRDAFGWVLDQFLAYGGYPGSVAYVHDADVWRDYIQNAILETVVGRDVPTLQNIQNPALFRQALHLACRHPAEVISLQKLVGQLQERGSVPTLAHYLDLLAAAFLIQPVQKWSDRAIRVKSSSPKLIVLNNALIGALQPYSPAEAIKDPEIRGRVIENAVGAAFVNGGEPTFYWNDRDRELDFVVQRGKQLLAIEVKSGRSKRFLGLRAFQSRHPEATPVRLAPSGGDLTLEYFFLNGI